MGKSRITVIGAGPGGLAMAADLAMRGYPVSVFNRGRERIAPLKEQGRVRSYGAVEGIGRLEKVTTSIREALDGATIIIVLVPAHAHKDMAALCAPHLSSGQLIVLCPGRLFGAIEFEATLKRNGLNAEIVLAETQTIPHTCRNLDATTVNVLAVKSGVRIAAFPAYKTKESLDLLQEALPIFTAAEDVLETGLNSIGPILHPIPTLLNVGRIQTETASFKYYREGITPSIARILERLDRERLAIGQALGTNVVSATEWLWEVYRARGDSLYEALQDTACYRTVEAPNSTNHRYILEDVPTGLVPLASLGELVGKHTPVSDTFADLACQVCDVDFRKEGRTLKRLGLDGMSVQQLRATVRDWWSALRKQTGVPVR